MATTVKNYILCSSILSAIAVILLITSIATNSWVVAEIRPSNQIESDTLHYGLYGGYFIMRPNTGSSTYNLYMECLRVASACVITCKITPLARQQELVIMALGIRPSPITCSATVAADVSRPLGFTPIISSSLYNTVNVFMYLQVTFAVFSTALALVTVIRYPNDIAFGSIGIAIASGVCGILGISVLLIWGIYFSNSGLSSHLAFSYVAAQSYNAYSSLGFSYWLIFPAAICSIGSAVAVRLSRMFGEK